MSCRLCFRNHDPALGSRTPRKNGGVIPRGLLPGISAKPLLSTVVELGKAKSLREWLVWKKRFQEDFSNTSNSSFPGLGGCGLLDLILWSDFVVAASQPR
jgi:hypothetical protein